MTIDLVNRGARVANSLAIKLERNYLLDHTNEYSTKDYSVAWPHTLRCQSRSPLVLYEGQERT